MSYSKIDVQSLILSLLEHNMDDTYTRQMEILDAVI